MGIGIRRPRLSKRIYMGYLCVTLAVTLSQAVSASDVIPTESLTDTLKEARRSTSAEVYFVPKLISTVTSLNKDEVPKNGCGYRVPQNGLADLHKLIERALIKVRSEPEPLSMRMLIRLHTPEGKLIELAFEGRPSGKGRALSGQVSGIDTSAATGFFDDVERWVAASALPATSKVSGSCP